MPLAMLTKGWMVAISIHICGSVSLIMVLRLVWAAKAPLLMLLLLILSLILSLIILCRANICTIEIKLLF